MSRQEIAAALNISVAEVCARAHRRFDEKARLSSASCALIWESIHDELTTQARNSLHRAKMAPIRNLATEQAHAEFDAADRANGWA